jgi:hypothetical protein
VVATALTSAQLLLVLPRFLDQGGKVFIDSGAFKAFQKNEQVDWAKVLNAYDSVLAMVEASSGLSIVAPDVIGDQEGTLALWQQFADKVRGWIDAGARVIVPLQQGDLSAGEMLARAKACFGSSRFCAGIPSNLAAMTAADCATLRHHDFHILGRVAMTGDLQDKIDVLMTNNPGASYTADANWLRSRMVKVSRAHEATCHPEQERFMDTRRTQAVRSVLRQEAYRSKCAQPRNSFQGEKPWRVFA